jgi:hypothetical protein
MNVYFILYITCCPTTRELLQQYSIKILAVWFSFGAVFLSKYKKKYDFEKEVIFKTHLSLLSTSTNKVEFGGLCSVLPFLAGPVVQNNKFKVFHAVTTHLSAWANCRQGKTLRSEECICTVSGVF